MNTLQAGHFYMFCVYLIVWTHRSSKCTLLVSFRARRTHTHAHTCAHTHTHTRANTHTHTHFSLGNSVSRVDCTFNVLLSNMSSNLVTVKTAFYNNRQTIDLILPLRFAQRGTNARCCEGNEVVLEETAIILRSKKKTLNKLSLI